MCVHLPHTCYQVVEGGWWEGILNEKVGWFPGNHVEEISPGNASIVVDLITVVLCSREQFSGIKGIR